MARTKYRWIEPTSNGEVDVYEYGKYERSSVLAGQERKAFVASFATVAEALTAYPKADVMGYRLSFPVSTMHLPDSEMTAWEEDNYFNPGDY